MPFNRSEYLGEPSGPQTGFSNRELITSLADSMEETGDSLQWSSEVKPQEFARGGVALTTRQAARRAQAELLNNRRKALYAGMSRDLAEYSKEEREKNISTTWTGVADLLSLGNYTTAGAALTYARTGSIYEAFRQAASEFANALPYLDEETTKRLGLPDPKRETFSQGLPTFLHKEAAKSDRWIATGIGLVLDIFGDPTTYIAPGAAIRKIAATKGGQEFTKLVAGATAPLREAQWVENSARMLGKAFIPHYDVKQLEKKGINIEGLEKFLPAQALAQFKGGKGAYEQVRLAHALGRAHLQGEARNVEEEVYRLLANTTEGEQLFLGSFLSQPDLLEKHLKEIAQAGGIAADRVPIILQKAKHANKILAGYAASDVKSGFLDQAMVRENYYYGTGPVNKRSDRMFDQFIKERGIERQVPAWEDAERQILKESTTPGFSKQKTYATLTDRLNDGIPTEMNVGYMVAKRGFRSAQAQATQTLFNTVLTNPEMAIRVTDDLGEEGWRELRRRGLTDFTATFGPTDQKMTYALPKEVAENLNRYQKKWQHPEEVAALLKASDWLTSMWKGSAVLSPGFHARNIMGQMFHDWGAGVGKPIRNKESFLSIENLPAPFLRTVNRILGRKDLNTANYMKLRAAATALQNGPEWLMQKEMAGLAPKELAEALKIHEGANFQGKILSTDELRDELQQYGIIDNGWSGSDAITDLEKTSLKSLETKQVHQRFWDLLRAPIGPKPQAIPQATGAGATGATGPLAQFTLGQTGKKTFGEMAAPWLGADNPAYKLNRAAGRFLENNARTAHYLDRRLRGWSPEKARQSVVKWHFDYSEMTDVEQQIFRRVVPFYTWSRKNMPLMFQAIASNPGRYAYIPKVKQAIESLSPEWAGVETPDYFQETQAVRLPIALDKKPLYWQPELPFLDINRANWRDVLASVHPVLGAGIEYATGESLFTGNPIERYEGELAKGKLGELGVSKEQQYFAGKLFPTLGLADRSFLRGEESVSLEPTGFSTLDTMRFGGLKIQPLDVHKERLNKIFKGMRASRNFMQKVREERARRAIWERRDAAEEE